MSLFFLSNLPFRFVGYSKLDLLSQLEVAGVDFYHYSFMRLEDLDRIESTLTELRWASRA